MSGDNSRIIDLASIAADSWFDNLSKEIDEFDDLAEAIGERFVGFSFITGTRITSIAFDPAAPETSQVDFCTADSEEVQSLPLSDFRERLGAALVGREADEGPLPDDAGPEEVRTYLGKRRILLCGLFGIRLVSLKVGDGEPTISVELGSVDEQVTRDGLHEILTNAVRAEVARARPNQPFSIDFKRVPRAEAANRDGNYDETIALLGSWPGPLSMFLRTAQGQSLGAPERSKLVRALGALGDAYIEKGQADWAEDVLRLGIQFGQEMSASGDLFGLLGKTRSMTGRHGEAIGLFRRALALGAEPITVLPGLALSFSERGRHVAAVACIEEALAAGAPAGDLEELHARVKKALGVGYERYAQLMASPAVGDSVS